jgi:hypothetical protein
MSDGFDFTVQPFHIRMRGDAPRPTEPLPLVIRAAREGETPNAFASPRAGHVRPTALDSRNADRWLNPTDAERAAARKYSEARSLLRRAETALPIEGFDDPIFDEDGEFYYSIGDMLDRVGEPTFAFVYEAGEEAFDWNPVDALEAWLHDCAYEDAADDLVDVAALNDAWIAWKAKQSLRWWNATRKIRIVDPEKFAARLAEAQAIVDAGDPDAHLRYPPAPGPSDQPAGACEVTGGTAGGAA